MSGRTVLYEVYYRGQRYTAILVHERGFMGIYKLIDRLAPSAGDARALSAPLVGSIGVDLLNEEDHSGTIIEFPLNLAAVYLRREPRVKETTKKTKAEKEAKKALRWVRGSRCRFGILILGAAAMDLAGWTLLLLRLFGVI